MQKHPAVVEAYLGAQAAEEVRQRERAAPGPGLTAGYGGAPVLRNLDLTVAPGEVVALARP